MSRPYGKLPPGGRKRPEAPQATEIQVNITERHTMEQIALEVQRALAMVHDYGATGLERFRFRLLPLDAAGEPMILRDELGEIVTTINIPEVPAEKPYRENEPGIGVLPAAAPKHGNRSSRQSTTTPATPGQRAPGAVPPRGR